MMPSGCCSNTSGWKVVAHTQVCTHAETTTLRKSGLPYVAYKEGCAGCIIAPR
jgi:hypothetical protein